MLLGATEVSPEKVTSKTSEYTDLSKKVAPRPMWLRAPVLEILFASFPGQSAFGGVSAFAHLQSSAGGRRYHGVEYLKEGAWRAAAT